MEKQSARIVKDRDEVPLVVRSDVTGPIQELSFLRRSLLFAELAMIAYNDEAEAKIGAALAGFADVSFYDRDGSQAYRFRNDHDCVIACRGTCCETFISHGETGQLVGFDAVSELRAAILHLIADPDLSARLGNNGFAAWRDRFQWHQVADRFETLWT